MNRRRALMEKLIRGGSMRRMTSEGVYLTPERSRFTPGRIPHLTMAFILMLSLLGFWWIWLTPAPIEHGVVPARGPRLRLLAADVSRPDAGTRMRSPVLMALPTPAGFSGAGITDEIGVGPHVAAPHGATRFLESADSVFRRDPMEDGESTRPVDDPLPALERSRDLGSGVNSVLTLRGRPPGVHMVFQGSPAHDHFVNATLPEGFHPNGSDGWACEVFMSFDSFGAVEHAFVDPVSDDPGRDGAILKRVYQWRLAEAGAHTHGRVRFFAFGSAVDAGDEVEEGGER